MYQPPPQSILYQIPLPAFITNFCKQTINFIVPHLLEIKAFINSQQYQTTVNPLIIIATFIIFIYTLKCIWTGLFGNRNDENIKHKTQSPQLNAQINDLKKQLKALKTSFTQLIRDIPQQNIIQQINPNKSFPLSSNEQSQMWSQILPLYTLSLQNNKKLVNYVLQSQFQMLKELKRFKKNQRSSLSSGRPSTSTIRSKTSDKKIQNSTSKSPFKNIITTVNSSIKKPQIKNSQRSIKSQINYQKNPFQKNDDSFLIKKTEPPHAQTKILPNSFETNEKIVLNTNNQKNIEKLSQITSKSQLNNNNTSLIPITSYNDESIIMNGHSKTKIYQHQIVTHTQVKVNVQDQAFSKVTVHESFTQTQRFQKFEQDISNVNMGVDELQNDEIMRVQNNGNQLIQPQVFVPGKIPVMKKMNLPIKGGIKRGPPPPPPRK